MSKKNLLVILTSILVMALLIACGEPAAPNETPTPEQASETSNGLVNLRFTIWSNNEAHLALLNEIAESYKTSHPNVTIQYETFPFGDYVGRLEEQLVSGAPPDAGWIVEHSASTFIKARTLADLGPKLKQDADYDFADLSESALQLWTEKEVVYGVPFSTSPLLILYNRDLFEAAGVETPDELLAQGKWTWAALAEAAKTIAEASPPGTYGFESLDGGVYSSLPWHTLMPIIRAYGGQAWNTEGTQCLLNSAEAVAAVQFYHDMVFVDESAVPPRERGDFYSGQSAMTIAQLSRVARLKDAPFGWGVAPLPDGPAGKSPVIGQAAIAVFEASRHKDIATDFVAFMTNKENVTRMAEFFPPTRISVLESEAFLESNPLIDPESMQQAVAAAIRQGAVLPTHVEFSKIDMTAGAEFDRLWVPEADVQAILTDICESIAPFLGQ